ncbi:MAG TPA: hypothetical protein VGJ56_13190 [Reyranella sp.]|jgi:hypothetical protein
MADDTTVHIGENSPEQVAYKLFRHIAFVEGKKVEGRMNDSSPPADRKWILTTYWECVRTVRGAKPGE